MDPRDAQASLARIGGMRERAADELVGHNFRLSAFTVPMLGLLLICASFDLPGPYWRPAVALLGMGLNVGFLIVHQRRAPVGRKMTAGEVALYLWAAGILLALIVTSLIAARMLDTPRPGLMTAGVVAVAWAPLGLGFRRLYGVFLCRNMPH
ncbi:hypothetical protein AB0L06_21315 [Spirillospora sp. NPDC052269]